jgi:hypothetical protein
MAAGKKTGGRRKGTPNKRTAKREEAVDQAAILIGGVIPDAFQGDAHAFLIAVYKDPRQEARARQDAAKAALPYEKPRLAAMTLASDPENPVVVRTELEVGRRLAFVLEMIARGEVKAKLPEAPVEQANPKT